MLQFRFASIYVMGQRKNERMPSIWYVMCTASQDRNRPFPNSCSSAYKYVIFSNEMITMWSGVRNKRKTHTHTRTKNQPTNKQMREKRAALAVVDALHVFTFLSLFGEYTTYCPIPCGFLTLCRLFSSHTHPLTTIFPLIHSTICVCVVYVKCHPDIYLHTDILLVFYLHWPAVDPDVVSFAYLAVI